MSIDPKPASVRPGIMDALIIESQSMFSNDMFSLRNKGKGSPVGMLPIVREGSMLKRTEITLTNIRATSVAGILRVRRGKDKMMTIVSNPNSRAAVDMPDDKAEAKFPIMSTTSTGDLSPSNGYICCSIMITPMPLMKPESTG